MPIFVDVLLLLAVIGLVFGSLIYCYRRSADASSTDGTAQILQSDLLQLQATNEQLQRDLATCRDAMHANAAFLANIGQELRTPLSGVIGMTELLMHTDLTNEQRELAKATMESADGLMDVISDLQDLARMESGQHNSQPAALNIKDVVKEACSSCADMARRKRLFLNIDCDPSIPKSVIGDRSALKQCLSKLLQNAVAATSKGGVVVRAAKLEEKLDTVTVAFVVKDSGIGLTDEEMKRLFTPFRGEDVYSRSFSGSGLGLYLCKRTIDTMGGAITVRSKKGSGTQFQFTLSLPIVRSEAPRQVRDDQEDSGNRLYSRLR